MKKIDFRSFLHFFVAFTIIFVLLGVITVQVLSSGIYNSTDENIDELSRNPAKLANMVMQESSSSTYFDVDGAKDRPQGNFSANVTVVLYDAKGNVLNPFKRGLADNMIFDGATFDTNSLDYIQTVKIPNPYGSEMQFRSKTIKVSFDNVSTNISYIQILVNTDQLSESLHRSRELIIYIMIAFWVLSIGVSMYLSSWSNRLIYKAYEKQKSFVENASHELRTPLAILQNRLEILFQRPDATIIEESENISESLNEVRNMRILTSNLLSLAKRNDGIKVNISQVDASFFENIFSGYELLAENKEKKFTSSVDINGNISLDESLIKQVLTILFDNAVKYTGDDGEIDIQIVEKNNYLTMTVADNGIGIPEEDRSKIFDRFYRVDKARTRAKGGFGLGLSLAKQIIDEFHGKIYITDNSPKGSKFVVKLKV